MKQKSNNKYKNTLIIIIGLFLLYLIGNLVSEYINPQLTIDENIYTINEQV